MANRKYKNAVQERKARTRITTKYHTRATTTFTFRFHKENDKDVISTLKGKDNKNDYIRQLILADIRKEGE